MTYVPHISIRPRKPKQPQYEQCRFCGNDGTGIITCSRCEPRVVKSGEGRTLKAILNTAMSTDAKKRKDGEGGDDADSDDDDDAEDGE